MRHVKVWGGNGYPEADTGPLTEAEARQLELRRKLEPPDAGRRKPGPPNMHGGAAPDVFQATGLPIAEDECQ